MKLTVNQINLLLEAAASLHGRVCVVTGNRSTRRNGWYGRRQSEAAISLRNAGLFTLAESSRFADKLCNGGWDRGFVTSWEITEAGRQAIAK